MVLGVFALVSVILVAAAVRPNTFVWSVFLIGPLPFGSLLREPTAATPLGAIHINALVVFAILIAALVALFVRGRDVFAALRASSLFAAFLAFACVSLVWAPDQGIAWRMLLKLATPYVFMLAVAAAVARSGAGAVLNAGLASGVIYTLLAVVTFALGGTDDDYLGLPGTSRAVSSGHLLAPYAAALAQACEQPGLWRIGATAAFALAILAGFTRVTIAGLFTATGAIFFTRSRAVFRILVPILGLLGFVALFTGVRAFRERMFLEYADRVSFDSVLADPGAAIDAISGSGRFLGWQVALDRLYAPSPVIGSGVGSAQTLFYESVAGPSAVHSEIVRLLCDVGWIGLILFVGAWIQLLWGVARRRGKTGDAMSSMRLAAIGAATAYLTFMLTDNGFDYVAQLGVFVYGFIGAALARREATQPVPTPRKRRLFDPQGTGEPVVSRPLLGAPLMMRKP